MGKTRRLSRAIEAAVRAYKTLGANRPSMAAVQWQEDSDREAVYTAYL